MDITSSIGLAGYALSFLLFSLLALTCFISAKNVNSQTRLKALLVTCSIWAASITSAYLFNYASLLIIHTTELLRSVTWVVFLFALAAPENTLPPHLLSAINQSKKNIALIIATLTLLSLGPLFIPETTLASYPQLLELPVILRIIMSVVSLLLIEQIYRNSDRVRRWAVKHLCLGAGLIHAYDFYLFADAALFKQLDNNLWDARGAINAIAIPLIALSIARMPSWTLKLQISRRLVFHTATLSGAGIYLITMAAAGYFIKFYGGNWGSVIQTVFIIGAALLLFTLLFSDKIRSNIRVQLNKHFFSYKYDYRDEWLKFTALLSDNTNDTPERICIAFATITKSPGCILWSRNTQGVYERVADFHMPESINFQANESLTHFLETSQWVIDLDEYKSTPQRYPNLVIPDNILSVPQAWLLLPLVFNDVLCGVILIKRSSFITVINWEDRDLLKIAGKQAAILLSQHQASKALIEAQQFEAFNRLSAYIVHDLKNILAQQSLIVTNAEKHKHNPVFVDDVIKTVKNSVQRMTKLMDQMRNGMRGKHPKRLELNLLCEQTCQRFLQSQPTPQLLLTDPIYIFADMEQLSNVIGHLVQNAIDATSKADEVVIKISQSQTEALIEIIDSGSGMDAQFIKTRLFKPFDSTKGLTGMGIGAYESREVIRALGGDIDVSSQIGLGSHFTVRLPLIME
ncbi:XrtA/PEP-CTERM system histidine kinase PrsK [Neptunomonas sp.]